MMGTHQPNIRTSFSVTSADEHITSLPYLPGSDKGRDRSVVQLLPHVRWGQRMFSRSTSSTLFRSYKYLLYVLGTRGGGLGTGYSQLCMIMLKLSPEYLVLKSVIELSGKIETVILEQQVKTRIIHSIRVFEIETPNSLSNCLT